jgi:hypothetical protein
MDPVNEEHPHAFLDFASERLHPKKHEGVLSVGPPGIEPGLYEPESYVLPVYYGP